MSLVIAVKKGDTVYFGADMQTTCGRHKDNILREFNYKVQKLSNGVLLSTTGSVRSKHLVLAHPELFAFDEKKGLTYEFLATKAVPKMYALFKEENALENKDGEIVKTGTRILVAWKDRLFEIAQDLTIYRYEYYQATGYMGTTQYALQNFDYGGDINAQILRALQTGAKFTDSVSGPYIFINSKDLTYSVVEEA